PCAIAGSLIPPSRLSPSPPVAGGGGVSTASLNFGPPLFTVKSYVCDSFDSLWILTLNRWANRFWIICRNCSLVAPGGTFAEISNRSLFIQPGAFSWYGLMSYACSSSIESVQFSQEKRVGSFVSGPPVEPIRMMPPVIGGAGLIDATSKVGD